VKQVDILAVCPETDKRVAIEVSLTSSPDWEADQAQRDLDAGADAVIVVCANRAAFTKLREIFATRLGGKADPRITLALPCHLAEAPSFRHVYGCPTLVYDPKWDKAKRKGFSGRR